MANGSKGAVTGGIDGLVDGDGLCGEGGRGGDGIREVLRYGVQRR